MSKDLTTTGGPSTPVPIKRPELAFTDQEKAIICRDLDNTEAIIFLRICNHLILDPLKGQIFAWVYNKNNPDKRKMVWYTSIDGKRALAARSGKYGGVVFERLRVKDKSGKSMTIDHEEYDPEEHVKIVSGTVGVQHLDYPQPIVGTAIFSSFAKTGAGSEVWQQHPTLMILKCAESRALAKGWPENPTYIAEEVKYSKQPLDVLDIPAIEGEAKSEAPASEGKNAKKAAPSQSSFLEDQTAQHYIERAWKYLEALKFDPKGKDYAAQLMVEHFEVNTIDEIPDEQAKEIESLVKSEEFKDQLRAENLLPIKRK